VRCSVQCYLDLTSKFFFYLETIKKQYAHDGDYKDLMLNCKEGQTRNKFVLTDGFVSRANKLSILTSSMHMLLLQEADGGLMGHFGVKKTDDIVCLVQDEESHGEIHCAAQSTKKLSHALILMICICLYLFLMHHRRIFYGLCFRAA